MIDYYAPKLDLTLLGCGFLGSYHLGAIYLLSQVWPQKPYNRICGASCGGLIGALLIAGLKLDLVLSTAMDLLRQLRYALKRPMQISSASSIGELVERSLERLLPPNAHLLCSNRLGVSVTKVGWPMENRFLSQFKSRRELIDAVSAGCFIPIWSGSLFGPKLAGSHFIDGAYSDNSPKFADHQQQHQNSESQAIVCPKKKTKANDVAKSGSKSLQYLEEERGEEEGEKDVSEADFVDATKAHGRPLRLEMSPFATQVDVSPRGEFYLFKARAFGTIYLANWQNVLRTWHALLPFHLTSYRPYLLGGHRDMKEYLLRNNLIKCRKCYARSLARHSQHEQEQEHHYLDGQICSPEDNNHSQGGMQTKCDTRAVETMTTNIETGENKAASACLSCLILLERVDALRIPDRTLNMLDE